MYAIFGIFLFVGYVRGNEYDLRVIDSINYERPCSNMGGICTIAADCPVGKLAEKGACPTQQKRGVECCYGVSTKETRCKKYGGDCVDPKSCNSRLIVHRALDCPTNLKCCVYVA